MHTNAAYMSTEIAPRIHEFKFGEILHNPRLLLNILEKNLVRYKNYTGLLMIRIETDLKSFL